MHSDERNIDGRFKSCLEVEIVDLIIERDHLCLGFASFDDPSEPPLLTDTDGRILVCRDPSAFQFFLGNESEVSISSGVFRVDIDQVRRAPRRPLDREAATAMWNAWSILDDLAAALGTPLQFKGRDRSIVLHKIFAAMGMESIVPENYDGYTPTLSKSERRKYQQMIDRGVEVVRSSTFTWIC